MKILFVLSGVIAGILTLLVVGTILAPALF